MLEDLKNMGIENDMDEKLSENNRDRIDKKGLESMSSMTGDFIEPYFKDEGEKESLFNEAEVDDFSKKYDFRKLILGIQKHLLAILFFMGLFSVLGYYAQNRYLHTYKAETVLLYQEDIPKTLPGGYSLTMLSLSTVIDMIKLPTNFQAVKSILGLSLDPKQMEGMTNVQTPRSNSNLIRIETRGETPQVVVDIANTLAAVAVKSSQEFYLRQLKLALDSFRNQLDIQTIRLTSELQEIEDFKKQNRYFEMNSEQSTLLGQLFSMKQKLQNATLEYNRVLVEYENLKREISQLPDKIPIENLMTTAKINPLQARISALESSLAEAKTKYAKENPKIKILENELKELEKQSQNRGSDSSQAPLLEKNDLKEKLQLEAMRMQGKVRSSQKVKEEIAVSLAVLEKELETLPQAQMAFSKLLQAKLNSEEQLKFLYNATETIQLILNVPKGSLELYQAADTATPLRDSWWVYILPILGMLFGLGLGVVWAMYREIRDPYYRTAEQLQIAYTIPCIAILPEIFFLNKKNVQDKTLFFIRTIADRLNKIIKEKSSENNLSCFSCTVTSAKADAGKSLLADHLARYYLRLNKKVLLLEMDYRPYIFDDSLPFASIEKYLHGEVSIEDIIIPGNPDRIKTENFQPDMKELLSSKKMDELWSYLQAHYDLLFVDAPGIIEDDYSTNLAQRTTSSLFVINSGKTKKHVVDNSLKELDLYDIRPAGIILNRISPMYIEDSRILAETHRNRRRIWNKFLFWRR
jgi:Mrp family chromosome partitioning ATPase/uncharacterized protein involved in exopolysaccharide biosynthesis